MAEIAARQDRSRIRLRRLAIGVVLAAALVALSSAAMLMLNRFGCAVGESDSCPGSSAYSPAHARVFGPDGIPSAGAVVRARGVRMDQRTLRADGAGRVCVLEPGGQRATFILVTAGTSSGVADPRLTRPAVRRTLRAAVGDGHPMVLTDPPRVVEGAVDVSDVLAPARLPVDRTATCAATLQALRWPDWEDVSGRAEPTVIVVLAVLMLVAGPLLLLTVLRLPRPGRRAAPSTPVLLAIVTAAILVAVCAVAVWYR